MVENATKAASFVQRTHRHISDEPEKPTMTMHGNIRIKIGDWHVPENMVALAGNFVARKSLTEPAGGGNFNGFFLMEKDKWNKQ